MASASFLLFTQKHALAPGAIVRKRGEYSVIIGFSEKKNKQTKKSDISLKYSGCCSPNEHNCHNLDWLCEFVEVKKNLDVLLNEPRSDRSRNQKFSSFLEFPCRSWRELNRGKQAKWVASKTFRLPHYKSINMKDVDGCWLMDGGTTCCWHGQKHSSCSGLGPNQHQSNTLRMLCTHKR